MISCAVAVRSVVTSAMSYPLVVLVLVVLPVSRMRMTRTVSVRHTPYHRQTCSVTRTVLVVPYRDTATVVQVADVAMWVGVPIRSPLSRGRPRFPVLGGAD